MGALLDSIQGMLKLSLLTGKCSKKATALSFRRHLHGASGLAHLKEVLRKYLWKLFKVGLLKNSIPFYFTQQRVDLLIVCFVEVE